MSTARRTQGTSPAPKMAINRGVRQGDDVARMKLDSRCFIFGTSYQCGAHGFIGQPVVPQ
uniref:Uncharacterized protein n=1 Tax=Rhizophora mucronata TaxID=61149 RepID=A0A2P2PQN7_RHIMU